MNLGRTARRLAATIREIRMMPSAARTALFVSHATPESNAFTLWLGAKLTALGFEVFADIMRLKGGNDWERILEDAIRNKAGKFLLVATPIAVDKQGVRNEIRIASETAKKIGDKDYIVPLRLEAFDAPLGIAHAQWILTELDPEDPDIAFGLCDLGMGFPELGNVSLSEIAAVTGPGGLHIERDLHFKATKTLQAYATEASRIQRIVT